MRNWLGPPPLAPQEPGYLDFRRARTFARSLGLRSRAEWNAWGRGSPRRGPRPIDIPAKPHVVYAGKGWCGWPDFLGFER